MTGSVIFIGAGPGAPDLITLRGARAIGRADIVIWAASLVHPGILEHARSDAEIIDSAQSRGVTLGFEPEPGMFIDTMDRFSQLQQRMGSPNLKLTLDRTLVYRATQNP